MPSSSAASTTASFKLVIESGSRLPTVGNGMAMHRIHHAASDRSLMGITPEFEVRIDETLLDEIDGPMLRHDLKDLYGRRIRLPPDRSVRPDKDQLGERVELFAAW